jgi:predicted transcriptional regulator
MDINKNDEVYGRITRVINELKMARQSVTIFKIAEMTGIERSVIFQYFYENGLLRGR